MQSVLIIFSLIFLMSCNSQEKKAPPKKVEIKKRPTNVQNKNPLAKKFTPTFKPEDFSIGGFNYIHYEFAKIMSLSVYSHSFDNVIKEETARKLEPDLDLYIKSIQKIRFNNFSDWKKINRKSFLINAYHAFLLKKMIKLNFQNLTEAELSKENGLYLFKKQYSFDSFRDKEIIAKYPTADMVLSLHCFSKNCPEFRNRIYNLKNVDKELNVSFHRYFKHPTKVIFDYEKKSLSLPAYITKYRRFFPKSKEGWADFLKNVFKPDSKQMKMLESKNLVIIYNI